VELETVGRAPPLVAGVLVCVRRSRPETRGARRGIRHMLPERAGRYSPKRRRPRGVGSTPHLPRRLALLLAGAAVGAPFSQVSSPVFLSVAVISCHRDIAITRRLSGMAAPVVPSRLALSALHATPLAPIRCSPAPKRLAPSAPARSAAAGTRRVRPKRTEWSCPP
jgi:hypothetical protein